MEELYIVFTRYTRDDNEKPVVHSYGPYTKGQASMIRKDMIAQFKNSPVGGTLEVYGTKILDPERRSLFVWGRA